jgi:hypothetical protein
MKRLAKEAVLKKEKQKKERELAKTNLCVNNVSLGVGINAVFSYKSQVEILTEKLKNVRVEERNLNKAYHKVLNVPMRRD